jgi:oligosaccharyltransferase complex subunit alpha (ribophorin I)
MRSFAVLATACLSLLSPLPAAAKVTGAAVSKIALPSTFTPPQVFKNANLVHVISLEKNFAKENINVVIENVSKEPQDEYFLPFSAEQMERVGGFEVKDRKDATVTGFAVEPVEFDPPRCVPSWTVAIRDSQPQTNKGAA